MRSKFGTAIAKGKDSLKVGQEAAKKAMDKAGAKDVSLSVVFASSAYDYKAVVKGVREVTNSAPLIGCSTAGEFTEEKVEKESVACAVISTDTHKFFSGIGKGLRENESKVLKDASSKFPASMQGYPYLSAILLVDGLAGKGEESVLAALDVLGPNVKFSGGSAADDLKFKETSIFVNDQVSSNAASLTLVASKIPVTIGVKHGHSPISPPLTITKAKGNVIYELDGKSALEVWKKYTRESAKSLGIDVDKMTKAEEVGMFFTRYEAGFSIKGGYKVRWPGLTAITEDPTTKGPITFACAMIEGMVVQIMESPKQAQIDSAKEAAEIALRAAKGVKLAGAIVFDCVCRAVILGDDFSKAVKKIKNVLGVPLIGFETYGEIAMEVGQLSGFHNTTTVVLLIPA